MLVIAGDAAGIGAAWAKRLVDEVASVVNIESVAADLPQIIKPRVLTPGLGKPEGIAAMVAFLALDDSAYVTGKAIVCDGGHLARQRIADGLRFETRAEP